MAIEDFQALARQNLTPMPDGRFFLPFSKTTGYEGVSNPDYPGTFWGSKFDDQTGWGVGQYGSLEDAFRSIPSSQVAVRGPGGNVLGINNRGFTDVEENALRGNYNDELGYFIDPSRLVGANPPSVGGKPNENGTWQLASILAPAALGVAGAASAGTVGANGAAAGTEIGGSAGTQTLSGGAAGDTLEAPASGTAPAASGSGANSSSLWGPILGNAIGAAANIYSAKKAAGTQAEAGREASATQLGMFNQARTDLEPWRTAGAAALSRLSEGIQPGGNLVRPFTMADFENDPVTQASFRYGLDEGVKGVNRAFGARGMLKSGAAIKALDRFVIDYTGAKAGESYNRFTTNQADIYNRFAGVAGTGQNASTQIADLGVNTGANIGANTVGVGNARGAASIATGNAISNAGGNIANAYQRQYYIDSLNNRPAPNNYYF